MLGSRYMPAASGGGVPRCFLFRLLPFPRAGVDPGAGPWPVKLRHNAAERGPDLYVGDSGVRGRMVGGGADMPVGPYVVDPDGERLGWTWLVEFVDEVGDVLLPGNPNDSRIRLLADETGPVAATFTSQPIVTEDCDQLRVAIIGNAQAGSNFSMQAYAPGDSDASPSELLVSGGLSAGSGASFTIGPGAVTSSGAVLPGFTALNGNANMVPRKVRFVQTGGLGSGVRCRIVVYGRRHAA